MLSIRAKTTGGKEITDPTKIRSLASRWYLSKPLLIAVCKSGNFRPILFSKTYQQMAFNSQKKYAQFCICYSLLAAILSFLFYFVSSGEKFLQLALALSSLFVYFLLEFYTVHQTINRAKKRALLFAKIRFSDKSCLAFAIFLVAIGAIQMGLTNYYEGFDQAIFAFGGIYNRIEEGEYWRLFTASFIHTGAAHWLANFSLTAIAVPLYVAATKQYGFVPFIIGCFIGALTAAVARNLGISDADAYAGVSAGIYSLLGYVFVFAHYSQKKSLESLSLSILYFVILTILISLLMYPKVSNISHVSGFIAGAVLAWLCTNTAINSAIVS